MELSQWAIWTLECPTKSETLHTAIGRADTHLNGGMLHCNICQRHSKVKIRRAWVIPIPEKDRIINE